MIAALALCLLALSESLHGILAQESSNSTIPPKCLASLAHALSGGANDSSIKTAVNEFVVCGQLKANALRVRDVSWP